MNRANHGHSYHNFRVTEHGHVHAGDTYNISHATFRGSATVETNYREVDVCLASCALLVAFLGTIEQLLLLIQTMTRQKTKEPSLSQQIIHHTACFEDAFGVKFVIDINFIGDWEGFQYLLNHAFLNKRGSQRVADFGYRLYCRAKGNDPIHPDPLIAPPFATVFRPGEEVQMSIHFEWNELHEKQCPSCGLQVDHDTVAEVVCARCNSHYRSQVGAAECMDTPAKVISINRMGRASVRRFPAERINGPTPDIPGHFHRISISAPVTGYHLHYKIRGEKPFPAEFQEARRIRWGKQTRREQTLRWAPVTTASTLRPASDFSSVPPTMDQSDGTM